MKRYLSALAFMGLGALGAIGIDRAIGDAGAEPVPAIKRSILQRIDVPGSNYEVVLGLAEVPANTASIGRHRHDGVEAGYAIEGEAVMSVEGQPALTMKAGDTYRIESGLAHDVATGSRPARVVAVYVVEKGKPLATPAP